jgi:hypothetical protein
MTALLLQPRRPRQRTAKLLPAWQMPRPLTIKLCDVLAAALQAAKVNDGRAGDALDADTADGKAVPPWQMSSPTTTELLLAWVLSC